MIEPPVNIVAQVGDGLIRLEDFELELQRRSGALGLRSDSLEEKTRVLRELIQSEALFQQARRAGYETNPAVQASLKRLMVQRYQADRLGVLEEQAALVTDSEVESFYRSNLHEFQIPERRRGAAIFVGFTLTATEVTNAARQKLEGIREQARGMAVDANEFARLVQAHSEDQVTRYRGGDTGWLEKKLHGRWPEPVVRALFELEKEGALSPVIPTVKGFYLVKLSEKTAARARPLAEVFDEIRYRLRRQREQQARTEFMAAQQADLPVRINDEMLKQAQVKTPRSEPLPGPLSTKL